ncbi:MAG: acetate--CoA ligase family protein [Arenicellales bacterium]
MSLKRLLQPHSIAVFGGREAREVVRQCRRMEFAGDIWPVHPSAGEVEGYRCFSSVEELPSSPDASFIGVNRRTTVDIVRSLSQKGAGGAVCYASGFKEVSDGEDLNDALIESAGGMPILGPNCYGVINYLDGALLWPDQHGGRRVDRGVALLTQSSNIGINLTMQARGLPLAYLIALGNQAQTDLATVLETLVEDDRVSAIGLYIEGFPDVRELEKVMGRARERRIPVVAVKSGVSAQGANITRSHTASMAGSDEAANALLKRLGIARVQDLDTLVESLKLLHVHGPLKGNRLCSMSCSGGEASLMADTAIGRDVVFPELTSEQHDSVRATVHDLVSVSNPLDYHTFAWNKEEDLFGTYSAMLACGFDLSMLVLDFPREDRCNLETWDPAVNAITRAVDKTQAPTAVVASLPESLPEKIATDLVGMGVAPLCGIRQALDAAQAASQIGAAWRRPLFEKALPGPGPHLEQPVENLDEAHAKGEIESFGVGVPRGERVASIDALKNAAQSLTYPLVLKACDAALLHKSDAGAVMVGIEDFDGLVAGAETLFSRYPSLLVEEMVTDTVCELIVGVRQDPVIGPWMMIGSGGIYAELLGDTRVTLLPARDDEFETMINSLKIHPLLNGYRGSEAGDVPALLATLQSVSDFVMKRRESLVELEINPLLVRPKDKGVCAVDAVLQFARAS